MAGEAPRVHLALGDVLIIVDVQNDFVPGGSLAVPHGDAIVPVLNRYIADFVARGLPVFATRDLHPPDHCSFQAQGGPWPVHCVKGSKGAQFAPGLVLPASASIISKATTPAADAYSGFSGTDLAQQLRSIGARRLFVGGLATDYCVLNTVKDALLEGFTTFLLTDAVAAVNVKPADGAAAEAQMLKLGAVALRRDLMAA